MNSDCLSAVTPVTTPERVITNWRRFSSGLWRVPEGDISAAYCAESFPKVKAFTHEGRLFTNCGGHFSGPLVASADCYHLIIAEEYRGPEPRRYSYEGREACYQRRIFKLGPKTVFAASEATIEEARRILRVMYADGGWFARQPTYANFLADQLSFETETGKEALRLEIAGELRAFSKDKMSRWLDASLICVENQQLDLSL